MDATSTISNDTPRVRAVAGRQGEVVNALLDRLPSMYPAVFQVRPEYAGVESLSSSSVDLKVMAKVDESNLYRARRLLNRELKLCLDEAGVEIPFPQVVVHKAGE